MTVLKNTDYIQSLTDLLLTQFQDSMLVKAMIKSLAEEMQQLEDMFWDLTYSRSVKTAIGAQLDGLGTIVNEPRKGRDDDSYREALLFRIFVNVSNGTPEDAIHILQTLTAANRIRIFEQFPSASYQLFSDGKTIPPNILDTMQDVAPAAVSDMSITISLGNTPYFIFSHDPNTQPLYFRTADISWQNIGIQLSDGSILEFATNDELSIGNQLVIENDQINPAYVSTPLLKNGIPLRNYLALALNGGGPFKLKDGTELYVGPASGLALENFPWHVFTGDEERDLEGEGFSEVGFMNLCLSNGDELTLANGDLFNVLEREGQIIEGYELDRTSFPHKLAVNNVEKFNLDDGSELSLFMNWSQFDAEGCGKLCDVLQKEGFLPIPLELSKY